MTLYEARPTLGGAVQTLPEREGDPEPPPDNGQHIALGCFTEYLRFLDRVGERDSYLRTRLALPVIAEDAARPTSRRACRPPPLPARRRARPRPHPARHAALPQRARRARRDVRLAAAPARRLATRRSSGSGTSSSGLRSTCRADEVDAEAGLFTVRTSLLGPRGNADLVLPLKPLGAMHGDAAGRVLGDRVRLDERVESLDDLDADAVVVAVPPRESARLLGEPVPHSRTRRS